MLAVVIPSVCVKGSSINVSVVCVGGTDEQSSPFDIGCVWWSLWGKVSVNEGEEAAELGTGFDEVGVEGQLNSVKAVVSGIGL